MLESHLKGRWIAITRPAHQAGPLIQRLEKEGANIIPFPLLEIVAPSSPDLTFKKVQQLSGYDLVVFISPNAVDKALELVDKAVFKQLNVAAVGKKTALSLRNHQISVDYFPETLFNSEALLALDALKQVAGLRVAIFRGEGGRDHLRDTLVSRGAMVDYIEVYARRCPVDNVEVLKQHYKADKLDIIVLTSGESLSHLLRLSNGDSWLSHVMLLVGSERIKKNYQHKFSGKLWVAKDPSDETIYQILTGKRCKGC